MQSSSSGSSSGVTVCVLDVPTTQSNMPSTCLGVLARECILPASIYTFVYVPARWPIRADGGGEEGVWPCVVLLFDTFRACSAWEGVAGNRKRCAASSPGLVVVFFVSERQPHQSGKESEPVWSCCLCFSTTPFLMLPNVGFRAFPHTIDHHFGELEPCARWRRAPFAALVCVVSPACQLASQPASDLDTRCHR